MEYCSTSTQFFAIVGFIVIAIGIYLGIFAIVREVVLAIKGKRMSELSRKEKEMVNLIAGFWPVTILIGLIYIPIKWIILPFTAAEKRDLNNMEQRLNKKIVLNSVVPKITTKFKVGDLIKGVKGNPDNYEHLNEGCLCRVLSIDEEGRMKVVLVNHERFNEHKDYVGNVFKAPARNFVKARKLIK